MLSSRIMDVKGGTSRMVLSFMSHVETDLGNLKGGNWIQDLGHAGEF